MVWGSNGQFEQIRAHLSPHVARQVIAGEEFAGHEQLSAHSDGFDAFLLATDPKQMVLDLHRHRLLSRRSADSELAIWVHGNESVFLQKKRWAASIKLTRRLLSGVGWRVFVASQSELR